MNTQVLSTSSITGTNVTNNLRENVGEIKDVMLNLRDGSVEYVVLSVGGFLGLGDKLFAVPMEAFDVDQTTETWSLNVDKETLKNAPGFDKDNWPKTGNTSTFRDSLYKHYGLQRRGFNNASQPTTSLS